MSVSVAVPALGESITEAIVSRWEHQVGDYIAQDEPLVELETDKITVSVPAPVGGILKEIHFGEEDTVEVGQIIATMEEAEAPERDDEEDASSEKQAAASDASSETQSANKRDALSPAVQRLVNENNLNPSDIPATGPRGHITKGDVLSYLESRKSKGGGSAKKEPAPQAPATVNTDALEERVKMSPLRKRIAERLVQAQQNAAILTTFNEVDMSEIMRLRKTYQDRFVKKYDHKLGFMSFFVKASIEALKAHPAVNSELGDGEVIYKNYYHIGIAVGGGKGLVVPVVRNADQLSFSQVELEIGRLAGKAKKNTLTLDDLTGGTFTISNGGIYGSMLSTPILNPPQVGILGMHNIVERAVVVDGEIVIRPMMYLALSYDHRIIDGREAVTFLVRIKECLENPERMLLEV